MLLKINGEIEKYATLFAANLRGIWRFLRRYIESEIECCLSRCQILQKLFASNLAIIRIVICWLYVLQVNFCIEAESGEWGVDALGKIWYDTQAENVLV